jgi:hypothetical protein
LYFKKRAETMAFLNKKKSFIGIDAPLGYVPGLGRGYVCLQLYFYVFNLVKISAF